MAATDFGKPRMARVTLAKGGDEVAGFAFEVCGAVLFAVKTREAQQLPRSGKQGGFQIEGDNPQLPPFDASVFALGVRDPVGGSPVELVAGYLIEGGLVVLEGVEGMAAGVGDDQRRFFWL